MPMKLFYFFIILFISSNSFSEIKQEDRQESWELGIAVQITMTCSWNSFNDKATIEENFRKFSKKLYSRSSDRDEMLEWYYEGLDSGSMIKFSQCATGVNKKKFTNKTKKALKGKFW